MLKGVNKHIVEINNPKNEYFDKAILFVRQDKLSLSAKALAEEAKEYLNSIGKPKKIKTADIIKLVLLILIITAIITALIFLF